MENLEKTIDLTGVRPTSNITIANYIGAIMPILAFQQEGINPYIFVADIHSLTDNDPEVLKYGDEILFDYLAIGIDPKKSFVYKQSDIAGEIGLLTLLLARHISVSELLRLPTLKEKIKATETVESANSLLLMYPVMMAADILIQRASIIPVGKDQESNVEAARKIARRFNLEIGEIFPEPQTHIVEMVKILSLRGESKMSKSQPEDAIFLTDNPDVVKRKINRAQTAGAGQTSESLNSHVALIKAICTDSEMIKEVDRIMQSHMEGMNVMSNFKQIFSEIVINFLSDFQSKREEIVQNKDKYLSDLKLSSDVAITHARETMKMVYDAFKL